MSTWYIYVVFIWFFKKMIIFVYGVDLLVFITEVECVYCAVRTDSKHFLGLS
jgi:hypothetical protein